MPKENIITIDQIKIIKSDIDKLKCVINVKDNVEANQRALDVTAGKIELEAIFKKHKGIKIQKIYT
jgi:hypothetical protein